MLSHTSYLEKKEVEILTKSDTPEDVKKRIKTQFEIKNVENKEWLSCPILILIIVWD